MNTRIVLYDDSKLRRESLSMLFMSVPDMELVESFPDCSTVCDDIARLRPDVVLMDIQMPITDGLKGLKIIRSGFPDIKIIMQTVFEDDEKVFEAIRSGASGYILKKSSPDKIIEAVREVLSGGAPITPSVASRVLSYFRQIPDKSAAAVANFDLTHREMEILELLSKGFSYKMIAVECSISIYTVNAHIRKIYDKLQVHSATEALAKANQSGLIGL